MSRNKVLIIGGNGFIGMNLARTLVGLGYSVASFDIATPKMCLPGVEYIAGNFFDEKILADALEGVDVIVHAISTINPSNSNEKYMQGYEMDFLQTVRLCEMASERKIRMIFLSSGGTVYGEQQHQPVAETAGVNPINHYASLKICIESVIRTFRAQKKLDAIVARISNPYGPGQDYLRGVGFIDAVLKRTLNGETTEIWGDGETVRDYIAIDDVCGMLAALMEYQGPYDLFNLSSGEGISQNDILNILRQAGLEVHVNYKESRNVDLKKIILDNSRIQQIYHKPLKSFREGLMEYYRWLQTEMERNA